MMMMMKAECATMSHLHKCPRGAAQMHPEARDALIPHKVERCLFYDYHI